jgi:integrase
MELDRGEPDKGSSPAKGFSAADRRISEDEIDRLCIGLGFADGEPVTTKAQAVAAAFLFAIETAMQAREICGLTAAMVVGKVAHLPATLTKIRRKRDVPLLSRAQPTCDADCAGGRRPAVRADITVAGCIVPEGQGAVLD